MNVTFRSICGNIPDLQEYLESDKVKVIPLRRGDKPPRDNAWTQREYSLKELQNYNGNFGIMPGYNHTNGVSLAIIDIDGYTIDGENKEYYKKATRDYIYNCLKDIPGAMIVQTQSGGYHIYLWNRKVTQKVHETSNNLHFPKDFMISELAGQSLKHSIEIFTRGGSKQCLLPGCVVLDKENHKENNYKIISNINQLQDIDVVDDVHQLVKETLTSKGFTYTQPKTTTDSNTSNEPTILKTLTDDEVKTVATLLIPVLQDTDGAKHEATLTIGGYLSKRISKQSTLKIANHIVKEIGDIFDDPNLFKKTLMVSYNRQNENQYGLPHLEEMLETYESDINFNRLKYDLNKHCQNRFIHSILTRKYSNTKKKYLDINYTDNKVSYHTFNISFEEDDEGNEVTKTFITDAYDVLNMSPIDIYETYNVLDQNASPNLCLTFYRNGMISKQTLMGDNIQNIEKQLERRPGIVLKPKESKGILNTIINEYVDLDLIHTKAEVPVPGVFCDPLTKTLVRKGFNGHQKIVMPKKDDVLDALSIWEDLHTIYPGNPVNLSFTTRWGIKSIFSYILKTMYTWMPGAFLYGPSRTSKTTLAEIGLNIYSVINDSISIGGGAFDTEYRIGQALRGQGIGLIVNEPGNSIESSKNIDILKRSVESKYSREKQEDGEHIRVPAYSSICFTSNSLLPTHDAFVRRFDYLEFTRDDRLTKEDIKLFKEKFQYQNWNNNRFNELLPIGDFFVSYANTHRDIFKQEHEKFCDTLLDALLDFAGEKKSKWKWLYQRAELMDIGSTDTEILSEFRRLILKDYKNESRNPSRMYNVDEDKGAVITDSLDLIIESSNNSFRDSLLNVIKSNRIDYLSYQLVNAGKYVFVNTSVKNALKEFCGLQQTCKGLANYMGYKYDSYHCAGGKARGFRIPLDKFFAFMEGSLLR